MPKLLNSFLKVNLRNSGTSKYPVLNDTFPKEKPASRLFVFFFKFEILMQYQQHFPESILEKSE
jgi:hypothetical protein